MNPFQMVRSLLPRRSAFNLSHEVKLTCDMGQLIPVLILEAVPGDHFTIGIEAVVRMMPMLAPLLHEVNFYVHYYFVPNRLMFPEPNGWESFITGGINGTDATALPTWIPTGGNVTNDDGNTVADNGVGSLWDFMGFPTGVIPAGAYPVSFPRRAYNLVYNQYYKDETQDADVNIDSSIVMQRRWEKDYFTSALPWQQRGTAPGLPVTTTGSAVWPASVFPNVNNPDRLTADMGIPTVKNSGLDARIFGEQMHTGAANWSAGGQINDTGTSANAGANLLAAFNANSLSATSVAFNISDLRLATQTQKWMERNARGGARYIEFLKNHFGVSPRDERLQRAEYIGGCRLPLIISEVLQTSATGVTGGSTPQGTMAGHGLTAGRDMCARYVASEYGVILGVMSIMPRSAYFQGISRTWLKSTRYDYYSPEFAHLSEQAVINAEVFAGAVSGTNTAVFGYQGKYNEMRYVPNRACSLMRPGVANSLAQWNLVRNFTVLPGLNSAFMKCVPDKTRIMAVPSQPTALVNIANLVKAVRPMPIEADPGLLDHS